MRGSDYGNNKLYFQMWVAELQSRFLKHPEYLKFLLRYIAITPQQGSLAITHAATSPELGPDPKKQNVGASNGRGGGKYINRIWEAPPKFYCNDLDARSRLWIKLDEELHLRDKGLLAVLGL
jgi:hypothetical protein